MKKEIEETEYQMYKRQMREMDDRAKIKSHPELSKELLLRFFSNGWQDKINESYDDSDKGFEYYYQKYISDK